MSASSDTAYTSQASVTSPPTILTSPPPVAPAPTSQQVTMAHDHEPTAQAEHERQGEPGAEVEVEPELDPTLLDALNSSRDRLFVLQSERDMLALLADSARSSNPRSSISLPLMNSYQRLLVHRCADLFGLAHAIDPSTKAVTLTVLETSKAPPFRLAQRVPPAVTPSAASPFTTRPFLSPESEIAPQAASSSAAASPSGTRSSSGGVAGTSPPTSRSVSASASTSSIGSASSSPATAAPTFKIMKRNPSAPRASPGVLALSLSSEQSNDAGPASETVSSTAASASSSSPASQSQVSTPNGTGSSSDPFYASTAALGTSATHSGAASSLASSTASLGATPVQDAPLKKKDRKNMTIEEREAAYKEARERIFQDFKPAPTGAASANGATVPSNSSPAGSTISAPGGTLLTEDGTRIGSAGSVPAVRSTSSSSSTVAADTAHSRELERREFTRGSHSTSSLPSATASLVGRRTPSSAHDPSSGRGINHGPAGMGRRSASTQTGLYASSSGQGHAMAPPGGVKHAHHATNMEGGGGGIWYGPAPSGSGNGPNTAVPMGMGPTPWYPNTTMANHGSANSMHASTNGSHAAQRPGSGHGYIGMHPPPVTHHPGPGHGPGGYAGEHSYIQQGQRFSQPQNMAHSHGPPLSMGIGPGGGPAPGQGYGQGGQLFNPYGPQGSWGPNASSAPAHAPSATPTSVPVTTTPSEAGSESSASATSRGMSTRRTLAAGLGSGADANWASRSHSSSPAPSAGSSSAMASGPPHGAPMVGGHDPSYFPHAQAHPSQASGYHMPAPYGFMTGPVADGSGAAYGHGPAHFGQVPHGHGYGYGSGGGPVHGAQGYGPAGVGVGVGVGPGPNPMPYGQARNGLQARRGPPSSSSSSTSGSTRPGHGQQQQQQQPPKMDASMGPSFGGGLPPGQGMAGRQTNGTSSPGEWPALGKVAASSSSNSGASSPAPSVASAGARRRVPGPGGEENGLVGGVGGGGGGSGRGSPFVRTLEVQGGPSYSFAARRSPTSSRPASTSTTSSGPPGVASTSAGLPAKHSLPARPDWVLNNSTNSGGLPRHLAPHASATMGGSGGGGGSAAAAAGGNLARGAEKPASTATAPSSVGGATSEGTLPSQAPPAGAEDGSTSASASLTALSTSLAEVKLGDEPSPSPSPNAPPAPVLESASSRAELTSAAAPT